MNFAEASDYWVFCTYETLVVRWMRARALAMTDADREVLKRMEATLRERLREGKRHTMTAEAIENLVLQTNGNRYISELLGGRFQVAEGFVPGHWYVVDHRDPGLLVRRDGTKSDIRYFVTREDAFDYVKQFTTIKEYVMDDVTLGADAGDTTDQGDQDMARTAKVVKETKTEKAPRAATDTRKAPAKKAAPKGVTSGEVKFPVEAKKGAGKTTATVTPISESGRRGRGISTGGTVASMTRDLISEGKLDEKAIIAKVQNAFPDAKIASNLVKHYHKQMIDRGLNPPAIKTA